MKKIPIILFTLFICQSVYAQLDFSAIKVLPKDGFGNEIQHGDVDGDGDQDVIFSTVTNPRIFVYFNTNGILSTKPVPAIPELIGTLNAFYPIPYTVDDFDKDGKDEIAYVDVVTPNSNSIKIIKYNATGFTTSIAINSQHPLARSIHSSDFNKDGILDLLVLSDQVYEYEGKTGGGYTEKKFTTPEIFEYKFVVADIDNDTYSDIIFFDLGFKICIYKNLQNGSFTFYKSIAAVTTAIRKILVNDFNNDTKNDFIVIDNGSNTNFEYIRQTANGNFESTTIDLQATVSCVDSFDKNNDGKLDLVFGNYQTGRITFLVNNGNGFDISFFDDPAANPLDIICLNLTSTNGEEIATLNFGENITTFENTSLSLRRIQNLPYSYLSTNSVLSDINKDGFTDLIMVNGLSNSISVFYKNKNGDFEEPIFILLEGAPHGIGSADFNNDGFPDIVVSLNDSPAAASLLLGNSSGMLSEPTYINGGIGSNIVIDDFNKDGNRDFFNGSYAFFGLGNGSFTSSYLANNCVSVSTGDYNFDSYPDLVISSISGLSFYLGKNGFGFNVGSNIVTNGLIVTLTSKDINDDSKVDIIATHTEGTISKFINNNGVFDGSPVTISGNATSIVLADFDNNTSIDMAVLDNNNSKVLIYTSMGAGDFSFFKEYKTGPHYYYTQILSTYQNNDNYIDLLLLNYGTPISILYNDLVVGPTKAPSALAVSQLTDKSGHVTLTAGDGNGRLLTIREDTNPEIQPTDNVFYATNANYGLGINIGNSNFAVMASNEASVQLTGLSEGKTYILSAFEYSVNSGKTIINYLISSKASVTFKTKKNQIITIPAVTTKTIGDSPFSINAISSSGLAVSLSVVSTNIALENSMIKILSPGSSKVKFSQSGNDEYMPAPDGEITFCANPAIPAITVSTASPGLFLLTSSSDVNNQWLFEGNAIVGAVNKTFSPLDNGTYSVKVDYSGCSNTSLPTSNLITGLEQDTHELSVYPNPVRDFLYINWSDSDPAVERILVIDALGRKSQINFSREHESLSLDLRSASEGMYSLIIQTDNKAIVQKILRQD